MDVGELRSLFDLTGRTAVVTGGTRGIGRAVAEGFAAAGANVVVASRKEDACRQTQAHLESMGASALGIAVNMGDSDSAETIVGAAVDRFGGLDIVVNNAANALAAPVGRQAAGMWQKSFEVNLRGPALPHRCRSPSSPCQWPRRGSQRDLGGGISVCTRRLHVCGDEGGHVVGHPLFRR